MLLGCPVQHARSGHVDGLGKEHGPLVERWRTLIFIDRRGGWEPSIGAIGGNLVGSHDSHRIYRGPESWV